MFDLVLIFAVIAQFLLYLSPVIAIVVVVLIVNKRGKGQASPENPAGTPPWLQQLIAAQYHQAYVQQMQQLALLIQQAESGGVSPDVQAQFAQQMSRAQMEMAAMDRIAQQRSETSMAGMMSDAASAGIDVSSWR